MSLPGKRNFEIDILLKIDKTLQKTLELDELCISCNRYATKINQAHMVTDNTMLKPRCVEKSCFLFVLQGALCHLHFQLFCFF